jgi:hypothetical protein
VQPTVPLLVTPLPEDPHAATPAARATNAPMTHISLDLLSIGAPPTVVPPTVQHEAPHFARRQGDAVPHLLSPMRARISDRPRSAR